MGKMFAIHFEDKPAASPEYNPEALCGTYSAFLTISTATKWKNVTCKKWLKKQPKREGN